MASVANLIQPIDVDPYTRRDYPASDPNLENLIDNWAHYKDHLIIFLGAGASVGARNTQGSPLPAAYHLRNAIWENFMLAPQDRAAFDFSNLALMTLEHAAALAEARSDIRTLKKFVSDYFLVDKPLWPHAVLRFLRAKAMLTTNYDTLVELGWALPTIGMKCKSLKQVFRDSDSLNSVFVPLYKPHGSIEFPLNKVGEGGLVLTQFDYFEMVNSRTRMLDQFMSAFNESCVLFIGYGFQDLDIASRLYAMRRNDRGPRWYAVFPRDNRDVRNMYAERYDIRQINRTFNDFLVDLDTAVDFVPQDWKFDKIDELIRRGFLQPRV